MMQEVSFATEEDQLRYGVQVLIEAGYSPSQIETMRGAGKVNGRNYAKELVAQRRHMVQELLAARLSNKQIAEILRTSKETVNADRHSNRALWTSEILKSQDTWRAQLVKEQAELKALALESFHQSKQKKTITTNNSGAETVRVEECAGESGFLAVARSCLEQQAKLIGLYDIKPQNDEKNGYKNFLDTLSKEVQRINAVEKGRTIEGIVIDTKDANGQEAEGENTGEEAEAE